MYYRRAKEVGYRARSAFKLLQIDETFNIFEGVTKAVDLCAAPGSWSQVLANQLCASSQTDPDQSAVAVDRRIVAVDLQDMAPIDGVSIFQGDITRTETADRIISLLGCKAQLVVCDGAPDVTGLHELDEYVQHQLLLAAMNIATFVLADGGVFVAKIFRGPNTDFLRAKLKLFFREVVVVKPKSSRNASAEAFIVCQGYKTPEGYIPLMIDAVRKIEFPPGATRVLGPFVARGSFSGFESAECENAVARDDDDG